VIVAVLRSGGMYRPDHVRELRAQIALWAPGEAFGCLTDTVIPGVLTHKLAHDWPGWWSKIELFRPGLFPDGLRLLYLDLDSVVVGSLAPLLARRERFLALEDFYRRPPEYARGLGSGVMGWTAGDPLVASWYHEFTSDPQTYMRACGYGGDQRYIETALTVGGTWSELTFWQDVCPAALVSYKVHCLNGQIPPGARVVCFHGRPKPWQVPALEAPWGSRCHT
jgi:hypothetical protein